MAKIWLFVFLAFVLQKGFSQTVSFTEILVDGAGVVTLSWDTPGISSPQKAEVQRKIGNAVSFDLLHSTTTFPFNSYTDATANANYQSNTYLVEITTATGTFSNSIQSIYLDVKESAQYNRVFELTWNSPYDGFSGEFSIYRKIQTGSWELIGLSDGLTYNDTLFGICEANVSYYVEYNNSTVHYKSNTVEESFSDKSAAPPQWNSVSTDISSQRIRLSWTPSPDKDIAGYIICEGEPCLTTDTIWGKDQSSFICYSCDPLEIYNFKIYSFDSCAVPNASILSDFQNNMVLAASSKTCSKEVQLSWNAYHNLAGELGGYNIFVQENTNSFKNVGTTTATTFSYEALEDVSSVRIYIEAFNKSSNVKPTSNAVSIIFDDDAKEYVNIEYVSVHENNAAIEMSVFLDSTVANANNELYRGINESHLVFYKNISSTGGTLTNFIDDDVSAYANIYFYSIKTPIGCISNRSVAMKTSISQTENTAAIEWTPYIGWDEVFFYSVERKIGSGNWLSIGTVTGSDLSFVDDISTYADSPERISYRIIANHRNGTKAASSVVEYIKEGYILMPNAFLPNSVSNALFKPRTFSVINEGYSFNIYARTGECMFKTNNPEEGWDGKFKGKICPLGGYVYIIQCVYTNGKTENISGSFLLVE